MLLLLLLDEDNSLNYCPTSSASINVQGDLVIAKVDSTKNEIDGIDIEGFPTIKMFKKETNEEIEYVGRDTFFGSKSCFLLTKNAFTGKKDLESMVKFIETGEQEEAEEEEDYDEDYDDDFGDDEDGEDEEDAEEDEDEVEEESTDAHDEL